ncbi:hypothetical protein FQV39_14860 [Bosea sp. F3-2]|nr:hypothetical protein FQV39_14860 [Bosea sp. F3-2]
MSEFDWGRAGLWAAVMMSGAYHGVNPGMGWPLAVSAGLMERSSRALWAALASLVLGHLLSMLAAILPFALLATLLDWQRQIQIAASLLLMGFGGFLLIRPRHPRALARIPPSQLMLWSFAVAVAHGAGLMLVPIYLGLCRSSDMDSGHRAVGVLINSSFDVALLVCLVHTLVLFVAAGISAWLVYRYLGLKFISRSWFNLDAIWAMSLVAIGALSLI